MNGPGPIVVVGSLNLDIVVQVQRLPEPGETVRGESLQQLAGGKGANQAVAAARLGAPVAMIGCVGDDAAGEMLRNSLRQDGIDDSGVLPCIGTPTGTALIHTDKLGQNSITVVAGANRLLTPEALDRHIDTIAGAAIVLAQLEVPLLTVEHLARLCGAHSVPLILDPAPALPLPESLLRAVAWLTPNETEAATLCGNAELEDAATLAQLHRTGARNVLLKQGRRGVLIGQDSQPAVRVPGLRVSALDATAAGDCFNGAFAVAVREGRPPEKAARFANVAAALSVTRKGAQISLPMRAEVDAQKFDPPAVGTPIADSFRP